MAPRRNLDLAVAIVIQNQGIIVFADGTIVHPNVDPQNEHLQEAASEIAANVAVMLAASSIKDSKTRAEVEKVAIKAIEAKAGALARR